MENVGVHPMLAFRKLLSEEFMREAGDVNRETVIRKLENDFHGDFREMLRSEYLDSYEDLQTDVLMDQEEMKMKFIDATTIANFYKLYDVYYSVAMN